MGLNLPIHGGNLAAAEARWGRPSQGWLDLSTGINPWPYPIPSLSGEIWGRLPGADEEEGLRAAAARCFRAPSSSHVLAAPGTSALIQALPRCRAVGAVAVVGPTYGEHARAWAVAGHHVQEVARLEDAHAPVVIVVNPNNPDGRRVGRDVLLARAADQAREGGLLLVDEAFGDESPHYSLAPDLMDGLVVLRSFGKFYGLAGLRLGFALALPSLLAPLAAQLGPWPVSGPALTIGAAALADDHWADNMRRRLAEQSAALDHVLMRHGLSVVGGTGLFRLASHPQAAGLYDHLGQAGILVRAFEGRGQVLRFGLPADSAELARLGRTLEGWA